MSYWAVYLKCPVTFEHGYVIWSVFVILIPLFITILTWMLLLFTLALLSSYLCSLKHIIFQPSFFIALGSPLSVTALIISGVPMDLLKVLFCFKISASS